MNRTLGCTAMLLAATAFAQLDEPDWPRDPPPVERATSSLNFFWRQCLRDAYPADPEAGVEKMSSVVAFKQVGGQYHGELRVGFYTLGGDELSPSSVQRAFAACVKQRFETQRLGSSHEKVEGRRFAIANPFGGASVVVNGELGRQRAVEVVAHQLELARAHCGTAGGLVSVMVDTNADGSTGAVTVTGAAGTKACVEQRLVKTLRFPAVNSPSRIEVPVPRER